MNSSRPTRVALVTGGARGIGREAALRLASEGYAVAILYVSKRDEADAVVSEISDSGGKALAVQADVGDEDAVEAAFSEVEETLGEVDVVVNAAGIMPLARIADLDLNVLDSIYRTNIRGAFVVSQQAARRVQEGGAIINFSSSVTRLQIPSYGAYAASKGAVEAMTLILARELRGRNVTANTIAPGPTATALFFHGKDQDTIDRIGNQSPLTRLGTPEDIAEAVSFIAGPGHWINGQVVYVNGGIA
jgi:3-oxoacyl-[acyl-carrier protein] reductase